MAVTLTNRPGLDRRLRRLLPRMRGKKGPNASRAAIRVQQILTRAGGRRVLEKLERRLARLPGMKVHE